MAARYLRSKVVTPPLHAESVVRHRLVDRMLESNAGVWLLSAPAGYGKTTLVLQCIEASSAPVAWFAIDRADSDPVRFWTHLAAAVIGEGRDLDRLLEDLDADRLDATVDSVLAVVEQREEPLILVLDDLHEVTDAQTLEILGRIMSHLPANLRLVITSRVDPSLPIGRLRAQGALAEVRAQDLAFTVEEAAAVFDGIDLGQSEAQSDDQGPDQDQAGIADIVERTEGWATALRLLAVSIRGSADAGQALGSLWADRGDIADFLSAEALGSLRPEIQSFLIKTSIVDELFPELADRLLGRPGSLAILRELARSQVFTDLVDPATNTFRYHRLFREFLQHRAEELDPDELAELHQVAADWYAQHDSPTATIEHAVDAGNDALAMRTIKRYFSEYGQAGRMPTALAWLERYGLERCLADPELRLMTAWVLLNVRRYDSIESWLRLPDGEDPGPSYKAQVHAVRSHTARHRGQLGLALQEAELAVAAIPDPRSDSDSDPEELDWSFPYGALILAKVIAGRPDFESASHSLMRGKPADNYSSMVIGYSGLAAWAMLDETKLDDAEAYADQALVFVTTPTLERFHQPVAALLVKSAVALARGHVGDAGVAAERAERVATTAIEPLFTVMARCQLARVAHAQGHPEKARRWLRDADALLIGADASELEDLIRRTRNETRFAHGDSDLPIELSERELAVLKLLPHKLSRKELGAQLFVSENTVKTHLTSLRHKLGVTGRSEDIVARAVELGLLAQQSDG